MECQRFYEISGFPYKDPRFKILETFSENKTGFLDLANFNEKSSLKLAKSLNRLWQKFCERFLPVLSKDTIWRYSRFPTTEDIEQGWKLHVSGTILTACDVLEIIGPFLESRKALYKVPISLPELKKINSGIYYNYAQIGKFITVYPQSDEQAVFFAEQLHQLTHQLMAPTVPFDFRLKPGSCIYYRYGAFTTLLVKKNDGASVFAIRDQKGNLIPDLRISDMPKPEWITNPFPSSAEEKEISEAPLISDYRIFRALSQRGKGGVYQALDLTGASPRFCLIKEGRKNGEVDWDGRDGFWRIQYEKYVLETLHNAGVSVPKVYSSFETPKNFYLVTEFIEGETLHVFLKKRKRRLSISQAIKFGIRLSLMIAQLHSVGWLWRDCKPDNLIVVENGDLRPIDFEGACPIKHLDYVPWSTLTADFFESNQKALRLSGINADLFALGAIIYLLLEGELPETASFNKKKSLRRKVPAQIRLLISQLLNPDSVKRPGARVVAQKLEAILESTKNFRAHYQQ